MPTEIETFMDEFYDTALTKREAMVERWFSKIRNEALEAAAERAEVEARQRDTTDHVVIATAIRLALAIRGMKLI